jgi:hypothetical protein
MVDPQAGGPRHQFTTGRPSAAGSNGSITVQTPAAISSRSATASTCPKTPRSHLINTPESMPQVGTTA